MQIVTQRDIANLLNHGAVLAAVKQSFVDHAAGRTQMPDPIHLMFLRADGGIAGDCHVKSAAMKDAPVFAIKLATGFYDNPKRGMPVNAGVVLVFSALTGEPVLLVQDGGLLTSWRTAAAGTLAAGLADIAAKPVLGILGAGHQAELQARWNCDTNGFRHVIIWARDASKARALAGRLVADGVSASVTASVSQVCREARVLITTTPASTPLVCQADISDVLHIVALGADSREKHEVATDIFSQAACVIVDDTAQAIRCGDTGHAMREGAIERDALHLLGHALEERVALPTNGVSVVDLTGLGAQDLAMASLIWNALESQPPATASNSREGRMQ